MKVTEKINDAYQLYILSDRNLSKTLRLTKITRPTLGKYIKIMERLDFSLLEYLDKTKNEKLSLTDAIYLCDNVMNPETQFNIFQNFILSPKKDRIKFINEESMCLICADSKKYLEFTPCCNTLICESCLIKTFEYKIQDLIFKPVDCPFCNVSFSLNYCRWFMKDRFKNNYKNIDNGSSDLWRHSTEYNHILEYWCGYYFNLYQKYMKIIDFIEKKNDYILADTEPDFKLLLGDDKYYGSCSQCTPKFENGSPKLKVNDWRYLQVCDIPKQCGNGEGGLLALNPEMFRCVVCKSRDENVNDGEFKKCPHCGIKTVKPDGCNYIYCGDHRWCWICNERIENNANGHNKHYWTGPGTSPYTNRCRESVKSDSDKYIITDVCDCSICKDNGGGPLCKNIDCMNRTNKMRHCDGDYYQKFCYTCEGQHLLVAQMGE